MPVKFEGNKNLHATHLEGGELDDVEKSVVVNEKIPRKRSYEEHLRSLNMVEKTDTAGYPEKEVRVNSTFVDSGKNEKYTFKSTCHPSVSPGKLETDNRRWNAASSGGRDSRIVSFMSGDEAEAFQVGRTLVGIDLSRFDSESDNDGETKRATGGRIPQVDGGDDEETSDEDSMDEVAHAEASLPAHKDSQSKDSEKLKQQSSSSEADSESDSEEAALPDDMPDSIPGWLSESLPEGALFHRQEPLHQVEAAWRATKDGELQECKERRRQALRHLQGMTKNGFIGSKRKRSK